MTPIITMSNRVLETDPLCKYSLEANRIKYLLRLMLKRCTEIFKQKELLHFCSDEKNISELCSDQNFLHHQPPLLLILKCLQCNKWNGQMTHRGNEEEMKRQELKSQNAIKRLEAVQFNALVVVDVRPLTLSNSKPCLLMQPPVNATETDGHGLFYCLWILSINCDTIQPIEWQIEILENRRQITHF